MHQRIFNFLQDRRFNRPAEQILADLIYLSAEYLVSLEHTRFGKAKKLDQRPDLDTDGNSYVELKVNPQYDDTFASGSGFVYYRIPIEVLVDGRTITINHPEDFKTHEVLDQINAQLGSQLTQHDVVNESWEGGAAVVITLKAHERSWVWNNEQAPKYPLTPLSPLILDGLVYTEPVEVA